MKPTDSTPSKCSPCTGRPMEIPGNHGLGCRKPASSRHGASPATILVLPLLALLLLPLRATAFDRFDIVTTEQLRDMLAERAAGKGENFLLVNTLDDILYRHEHIPGSVSLPWARVADYESVLGGAKDKSLIFY